MIGRRQISESEFGMKQKVLCDFTGSGTALSVEVLVGNWSGIWGWNYRLEQRNERFWTGLFENSGVLQSFSFSS